MRAWKHMATAPKDGTLVTLSTMLGGETEGRYVDCRWVDDDGKTIRIPMYWTEINQSEEVK